MNTIGRQSLKFLPFVIALALLPLFLPGGRLGSYYLTLAILAMSYAISTLGLTVLLGYAGQISLAQAAFYGIGSYMFAILVLHEHMSYWLAFLVSLFVSSLFGLILGAIALRLTTHYLALVTIGFQTIISLVLNNWNTMTGGADGISGIPRPILFGIDFSNDKFFYWLIIFFLVVSCYVVYRLRHSRIGNALLALREDEIAAASAGINLFWAKIIAFSIGAALGGLGGILYASGSMYISPNVYTFDQSVLFFSMVLVGGQESIVGSIMGAVLLTFLPEWLRFLQQFYIAVYGFLVVVVVLFLPGGIFGTGRTCLNWIGRKFSKRKSLQLADSVFARQDPRALKRPTSTSEVVLEVSQLHKHFGGIKAVNGVDLTVKKGDIAVLIGPNGSGKTTVLNVISGIYQPTSGEVRFKGQDITAWKSHNINRVGISRTFQNIRLFPELTALENVVVGYYPKGRTGLFGTLISRRKGYQEERVAEERARRSLELLGFTRFDEKAKNLPYGQQRIVEIARAIVCEPELLLLDEPAAGMNPEETENLSLILYRLHQLGLTVLLIEHDMSFVHNVATYAYVLDFGSKISEGKVADVLRDPHVIKAYLGDDADYDYA